MSVPSVSLWSDSQVLVCSVGSLVISMRPPAREPLETEHGCGRGAMWGAQSMTPTMQEQESPSLGTGPVGIPRAGPSLK